MKKQSPQKTTSQSDKGTPLTDAFLEKYFKICDETGQNLNGLDRAHFVAIIKQYYIVEEILDMVETIQKHEENRKMMEEINKVCYPQKKEEKPVGPTIITAESEY